jgi:hypothetical protein
LTRFSPLLALVLACLLSPPALAKDTPSFMSVGGGIYDFDKHPDNRVSADYRLEYRSGVSLLPLLSRGTFKEVDSWLRIHPTLGVEGNTKGAVYLNGGINIDVEFLKFFVFTWGQTVGAFEQGNDRCDLGSVFQIRSQAELGFRLPNEMRVTGFISHISNAAVVDKDPGAEIVGVYLHVPLTWFGGK